MNTNKPTTTTPPTAATTAAPAGPVSRVSAAEADAHWRRWQTLMLVSGAAGLAITAGLIGTATWMLGTRSELFPAGAVHGPRAWLYAMLLLAALLWLADWGWTRIRVLRRFCEDMPMPLDENGNRLPVDDEPPDEEVVTVEQGPSWPWRFLVLEIVGLLVPTWPQLWVMWQTNSPQALGQWSLNACAHLVLLAPLAGGLFVATTVGEHLMCKVVDRTERAVSIARADQARRAAVAREVATDA